MMQPVFLHNPFVLLLEPFLLRLLISNAIVSQHIVPDSNKYLKMSSYFTSAYTQYSDECIDMIVRFCTVCLCFNLHGPVKRLHRSVT